MSSSDGVGMNGGVWVFLSSVSVSHAVPVPVIRNTLAALSYVGGYLGTCIQVV